MVFIPSAGVSEEMFEYYGNVHVYILPRDGGI